MEPAKNDIKDQESLAKPNSRKDIWMFIIVMAVFTFGMVLLLIYDVSAWWIWYLYFVIWTLIEIRIARNIKLKWWHWVIIILVILSIDILVFELIE